MNRSGYRLFVEQYPDTLYAKLAGEQIRKLETVVTPPAPSPEAVEASLGLKPADRERIQIGLWALGFNTGSPDGKFGSRTREAIRKWQASRGHETTGHLDAGSKNAPPGRGPGPLRPNLVNGAEQALQGMESQAESR